MNTDGINNNRSHWLTFMLQGVISEQHLCHNLSLKSNEQGIVSNNQVIGSWDVEVHKHQIAVTIYLFDKPHDYSDLNTLITTLRDWGLRIAKSVLQAQAVINKVRLTLASYTFVYQEYGVAMQPGWVELNVRKSEKIAELTNKDFAWALGLSWEAINDEYLQRALRDYDLALDFDDENRLIYLWRAVEEILWAHYKPRPGTTIPRNPPYGPAAIDLCLFWSKADKDQWFGEIAQVAHSYARHAQSNPYKPTLPGKLHDCIDAIQSRVVVLILRHIQFLRGSSALKEPDEDMLKGWLKTGKP